MMPHGKKKWNCTGRCRTSWLMKALTAAGGSLVQDIDSELETEIQHASKPEDRARHDILIEQGTRLIEASGSFSSTNWRSPRSSSRCPEPDPHLPPSPSFCIGCNARRSSPDGASGPSPDWPIRPADSRLEMSSVDRRFVPASTRSTRAIRRRPRASALRRPSPGGREACR